MPESSRAIRQPIPIVVLNWNGLEDTIECVAAMLQQSYQNFVIHLIDNGSDEGDFERLDELYRNDSRIAVSSNPTNLGFTRGVNQALEAILTEVHVSPVVVLLNNDTIAEPDWLQSLVTTWQKSGCAAVASQMINYYQPEQLDNAGHIWLDSGEILPRGTGQHPLAYNKPAELVGGCAGALLVSTDVLKEIGLFDPFFDTGYEDAEWGLRAYLAGYPTLYAPGARIFHKVSRSVDKIRSAAYAMKIQTNINYTYFKLAPWPLVMLNSPWLLIKTLGVLLVSAVTLRRRILTAHLGALAQTLRSLPAIRAARRQSAPLRQLSAWRAFRAQVFFLPRYLAYFRDYIVSGKKTVFER